MLPNGTVRRGSASRKRIVAWAAAAALMVSVAGVGIESASAAQIHRTPTFNSRVQVTNATSSVKKQVTKRLDPCRGEKPGVCPDYP